MVLENGIHQNSELVFIEGHKDKMDDGDPICNGCYELEKGKGGGGIEDDQNDLKIKISMDWIWSYSMMYWKRLIWSKR